MLGQALVESNDPARLAEAVSVLEASLTRDPDSPEAYNQLAMAYGRKGDLAHADLASAQSALERGDIKVARMLADRARDRFPGGSPTGSRPTTFQAATARGYRERHRGGASEIRRSIDLPKRI